MSAQPNLVAVVNEDAAFIQLVRRLLEQEGWQSIAVPSSDMTYPTIAEAQPAVVVLDVNAEHPERVWKLVDLLLLDPDTASMPLVLAAAPTTDLRERRERLETQGCVVIEKPFRLDELIGAVRAKLDAPR